MGWNDFIVTVGTVLAIASSIFSLGLVIKIVSEEIGKRRKCRKVVFDVRRFYNYASEQCRNCGTITENCKTITIEGETVEYTPGKTIAEICTELEQKKVPRRIRHLAFCAKKARVRKKNRARLKKYERK